MGAFWSQQDIADQKASRYFGVIGKILDAIPATLFVAGSNQQQKVLQLSDIFDYEKDKLHETSDYTISETLLANITEQRYSPAKAATGTTNYYNSKNKNSSAYYYDDYDYNNNYTANTTGYSKTKLDLINKINAFSYLYTLNLDKLEDLSKAFLNYVEAEVTSQHLPKSLTGKFVEDMMDSLAHEAQLSYDWLSETIKEELDVRNPGKKNSQKNKTINKEVDLVVDPNLAKQAYDDGVEAFGIGLSESETLHWYSYTDDLKEDLLKGYRAAFQSYTQDGILPPV